MTDGVTTYREAGTGDPCPVCGGDLDDAPGWPVGTDEDCFDQHHVLDRVPQGGHGLRLWRSWLAACRDMEDREAGTIKKVDV